MQSNFRLLWNKPQLHDPGSDAKRVTWLELFYDLIFVVVIARLAHHLAAHPDLKTLTEFVLLFIPVWWVWLSIAYYNERFETFDLSFRAFTFLQMLSVAAIAATAEYGFSKTATGFALSYAFARAIITFMWWRAGRHNPKTRVVTNVYVRNFSLSIVLWVIAAFVGGPVGLALKAAGLLIDLITPILTLKDQPKAFPAAARKLPERFGLFVIIVLGENLVGIVNGLADAGTVDLVTLVRFGLGFLLGFGLWWIYFDYIGRLEPDSHNRWKFISWSYLHLPLVIGITMMGAMIQHAIAPQVGETHSVEVGVRWLLAGGFALFYLACAGLEYTLEEGGTLIPAKTIVPLRIATAGVALLLPLLPVTLSWMVVGLILLHVVHATLGVRAWFSSGNMGRTDVH